VKAEDRRIPHDSAVAGNGVRYSVRGGRLITEIDPGVVTEDTGPLSPEGMLWTPVKEWRGTGSHTTESFAVRTPIWRVVAAGTLTREAGFRRVGVYDGSGRRVMYEERETSGTDTTCLRAGPGVFHLDIGGGFMRWNVRVEEMHLPAERADQP
jgi:hypothetical protein